MDGKQLLETWFRQVWLEGDVGAVDRMFAPTTEATGMMEFAVGAEDFKALVPAFMALVDDVELTIVRVVEQAGWIAALLAIHGVARPNGRRISVSGQLMARMENGTFVEAYNNFDLLAFFEQIGALPDDAVALALAGEPICP